MTKKILIAGAGGYIGSQMTEEFLKKGLHVVALDRFYFGDTLEDLKKNRNLEIIKADIRNFDENILKNVEAVINLASISNDPASELNPKITNSINYLGAINLARASKKMKVKKYLFSSSCSVYGASQEDLVETSALNPISVYAKSKIKAEKKLLSLADKNFSVTIPRLATIYGVSKRRMRFDLIINLMTLHAWKNNRIFVMGGGDQWRPLLHIDDCINFFYTAIQKSPSLINKQIFNIGSNVQNYTVMQVASEFKKYFPSLLIDRIPDDPDPRNYKVNFDKVKKILYFKPKKTIRNGINEVRLSLEKGEITDSPHTNTLNYYKFLMESEAVLSSVKLKNKLF
jgi:nucleoside-diphosphate-sugar epimerase